MKIAFQVPSVASPQGSKTYVGRGRMVESSKNVAPYRALVSLVASSMMAERKQEIVQSGPVAIALTFAFPRPKAHYRKDGTVRENAPLFVVTTPDIDKAVRSTLDALTGICFANDNQVADLPGVRKIYTNGGGYVNVVVWSFDAITGEGHDK